MSGFFDFIAKTKDFFLQNGSLGLFILAFSEASFFPIPPDVVLIPLAVVSPAKALYYAAITSIASTLGGVFGYFIGVRAGRPVLSRFVKGKNFYRIEDMFLRYGAWAVAVAGFTPIPYKVFTIASGVFHMRLFTFFIAALLSRSARFFLEGAVVMAMGEKAVVYIDRLLGPGSFLLAAAALGIYLVLKRSRISLQFQANKIPAYVFLKNALEKFLARYGEFGIYLLGGLSVAGTLGMLFLKLTTELLEKELTGVDLGIINSVNAIKNPYLDYAVKAVNMLQEPAFLLMFFAAGLVCSYVLYGKARYPFVTFVAFAGSFAVQWMLKSIIQRPRISPGVYVPDFLIYSFPSGLTLLVTAFSGYLVFLTARKIKRWSKIIIAILWFIFILLVGMSRVYAGISYPSDVLAGLLIGGVWLVSCIVATKALEYYGL
jgi:undecaprenyl-diphosphatase